LTVQYLTDTEIRFTKKQASSHMLSLLWSYLRSSKILLRF